MYESYFGLNQEPFSIAPDPRFLYMSDKHREALELLNYGLLRGASFVLLTGEIGAGKTTVWRRFLEALPSNIDVANVVNPKLDVTALLARVCDDLQVTLPEGAGTVDLIDALHGHLLLAHAQGRRTLIVIDEAQALSSDVLEQLRLLTNLDTSGKRLQVMLIGQPELRQMLERPALEPLAQRVVARYHLSTLSAGETVSYIAHRLKVAGLNGPLPFDGESISLIHRLCRGVPRRINAVCDRALAAAHISGQRRVDRNIVERAAVEVFGRKAAPAPAPTPASVGNLPPVRSKTAVRVWTTGVTGLALAALVWSAAQFGLLPAGLTGPARASTPAPTGLAATTVSAPPLNPPSVPATASVAAVAEVAAGSVPVATAAPPVRFGSTTTAGPPTGIDAAFVPGTANEAQAWRALAGFWGTTLGAGEPCVAAAQYSLQCFRSTGGLATIRQLDRPSALRLGDERGRVAHVLLVGLNDASATLNLGGTEMTMPLLQLARLWRGEFATYWRAPPGYRPGDIAQNDDAVAGWLLKRLAEVDGLGTAKVTDDALRSRIAAFQVAQGLKPDGLAGPLTLMQLGRASGVDEPRLSRQAAR